MGGTQCLLCAGAFASVGVVMCAERGPAAQWPSAAEAEPAARNQHLGAFGLIGFESLVGEAGPLATTLARRTTS